MSKFIIDKRTLITSMGGLALSSLMPIHQGFAESNKGSAKKLFGKKLFGKELFASAFHKDKQFGVAILTQEGEELFSLALPERGHDVAFSNDQHWGVVFARRPGNFAIAFDPKNQRHPKSFYTPNDRHFYGHGVFSADNKLLYATENDFENSTGVIGIYDATDGFRRIGEIWSGGTGPHDILLMSDQKTLVVANGGIDTHPFYGRTKLNIDSMMPNIVMIDSELGVPLSAYKLPDEMHQISLRHLALAPNGDVWIAGQKEGALLQLDKLPLIFKISQGEPIKEILLPPEVNKKMQGYIGSIDVCYDGQIAVSSPRGNLVAKFNPEDTSDIELIEAPKLCGLAVTKQGLVASSEQGLWLNGDERKQHERLWDNHIEALM